MAATPPQYTSADALIVWLPESEKDSVALLRVSVTVMDVVGVPSVKVRLTVNMEIVEDNESDVVYDRDREMVVDALIEKVNVPDADDVNVSDMVIVKVDVAVGVGGGVMVKVDVDEGVAGSDNDAVVVLVVVPTGVTVADVVHVADSELLA